MSIPKCTLASSVGLFPTQLLNTYVGTTLRNMEEIYTSQADSYIILIVQVLVTGCLLVYVFRRARHEINKAMALSDTEQRCVEEGHIVNAQVKPLPRNASSGMLSTKVSRVIFVSSLLVALLPVFMSSIVSACLGSRVSGKWKVLLITCKDSLR